MNKRAIIDIINTVDSIEPDSMIVFHLLSTITFNVYISDITVTDNYIVLNTPDGYTHFVPYNSIEYVTS